MRLIFQIIVVGMFIFLAIKCSEGNVESNMIFGISLRNFLGFGSDLPRSDGDSVRATIPEVVIGGAGIPETAIGLPRSRNRFSCVLNSGIITTCLSRGETCYESKGQTCCSSTCVYDRVEGTIGERSCNCAKSSQMFVRCNKNSDCGFQCAKGKRGPKCRGTPKTCRCG